MNHSFGSLIRQGGIVAIGLSTLGASDPAFAQGACASDKLLASDGAAHDVFGYSVGISGDVVLIGAYRDDDQGTTSGSAYVFRHNGDSWLQEQKLLPADGAAGDMFGFSVALCGDAAVIGARLDDDNGLNAGAAYVFRFNGTSWVQEQQLLASVGGGHAFGYAVAICGDPPQRIIVGAWGDDNSSGSAYVFRFNGTNWVQEQRLLASDGAPGDRFAYSVAICGEAAVIGAWRDEDNGFESGSAYVFRDSGDGWIQEQKLQPGDGGLGDEFGISVAIDNDTALIGAHFNDDNGPESGSAYVFRYNGTTWLQEQKFLPSDGAVGDQFGWSVAIAGDTAAVGAYTEDPTAPASGSVYEFRFDGSTWVQQDKLFASDGAIGDDFGYAVAVSKDPPQRIVAGVRFDDDNDPDSGSAYVFDPKPKPSTGDCNSIDDGNVDLARLLASDGTPLDRFGSSVAIDGDIAVVGAYWDDQACPDHPFCNSGSAYVFRYNGSSWVQEQQLLAPDADAADYFGRAVAIDGDPPQRIVIGALLDDDNGLNAGAAHVFQFDGEGWVWEQKLLASDGTIYDEFGESVGISGDTIVIGAVWDDDACPGDPKCNSGSAYVFRDSGDGWIQEQKLVADNTSHGDFFGISAAIDGDVILIGAKYTASFVGSAYVFRFDGSSWVQEQWIYASDGHTGTTFGYSVAIDRDTALIGARGDDDNGLESGSAYVFRYDGSTWAQEQKLLPSDGAANDRFGHSVALVGDTALIGAPDHDDFGTNVGAVYAFRFDGTAWGEQQELFAPDGAVGDEFGFSLALSSDTALIGARFDDDNGRHSGSAYVFDVAAPGKCPWDLDDNAVVGVSDLLALLASWGPCKGCPADFDGNGNVGVSDLLVLLANWGPCP